MSGPAGFSVTFTELVDKYKKLQATLTDRVRTLASSFSSANPGTFLLLQFQYSQLTQIGESVSNLIAQVNSVINHAVNNQGKN